MRQDLKTELITFGRKQDCDVVLTTDSLFCAATAYSNVHFKIKRVFYIFCYILGIFLLNSNFSIKEFSIKTGSHALLEDCSSNGTFVNGEKLGN